LARSIIADGPLLCGIAHRRAHRMCLDRYPIQLISTIAGPAPGAHSAPYPSSSGGTSGSPGTSSGMT
jgi:hypothetical protein